MRGRTKLKPSLGQKEMRSQARKDGLDRAVHIGKNYATYIYWWIMTAHGDLELSQDLRLLLFRCRTKMLEIIKLETEEV